MEFIETEGTGASKGRLRREDPPQQGACSRTREQAETARGWAAVSPPWRADVSGGGQQGAATCPLRQGQSQQHR